MKDLKKKLNNNFAKGVLMLVGGTASAQIINLMFYPMITRLYSPEDFGILTLYISLLGMLAIISSFKYELGIVIADDDREAVNVLALSLITLFIFTTVITMFMIFSGEVFFRIFNSTTLLEYQFLVPLGIFLIGSYNVFLHWALRKNDYKSISKTKFTQSLSQNLVKIFFGYTNIGALGLLSGSVIGQSVGITALSSSLFSKDKYLLREISKKRIIWNARRFRRFPFFSAPSQFLNNAGLLLPVFFIASLYGSATIGFYGLANTIVNLPMNLLGKSISDVFYGEAAKIARTNPKKLKSIAISLFKKLFLIGLLPLIILIVFGPFLFTLVFGEIWLEAGLYSRIIAFSVFSRFVFTPITKVFSILERQKDELFFDVVRVTLVIIVFIIVKLLLLNSFWFLGLYTLVLSFTYFVTYLWAMKTIEDEIKNIEKISE